MIRLPWIEMKEFASVADARRSFAEMASKYVITSTVDDVRFHCLIAKTDPANEEQVDFEANNKATWVTELRREVFTQYEKDDKDLKLAKAKEVVNPSTSKATVSLKVPGTFGVDPDARFIAGGYGFISDYDSDDYVTCRCYDHDRKVAWAVALAQDPNATAPIPDEVIRQMGVLPAPISRAFPDYPLAKGYTDDDLPEANRGWWTWPMPMGNNLQPMGECEVEPIGGYGKIPAGFYIDVTLHRTKTTGWIQLCYFWGKKG